MILTKKPSLNCDIMANLAAEVWKIVLNRTVFISFRHSGYKNYVGCLLIPEQAADPAICQIKRLIPKYSRDIPVLHGYQTSTKFTEHPLI